MTGSFLWAQRLSTVALLAAVVCGASETCCERLAKGLSHKVIAPLNPEYLIENNKYWSSRSVLTPSCILVPESSSDVAKALKILVKNNCEFAFTDIKVSKDEKSVIVGAGNRWGDVYTETEKYGVTVAGGRVSSVGVSGFLLGGGLSFLMHSEGFAANSVLSYEVVLANGTVSIVTAKSAGDLFKALKGGTGNFGIATSFTLQAYAIKDVYAGNLYYTPDKYDMLFPIMEQFARTELSSDLSIALKILVEDDCEFAIRGGGHTPNPGWASTNSGVLISLSGLTAIQVSQDKQSVVIGAGNRWGDVYSKIGEYDVTVTGGRISPVGVSGFLLGGGLSYLMHSKGFSANNILSYEIVLANGTISTVTAESAGDLFRALKGGTGNFGLVTSFTLQTYPISQVYAGNLYYSPDNYDALFPLMEEYACKGVESDPNLM
ncbi:FAD-binding domain protein [Rhizoctonia solani]|uniref:FAD-binding domain protein n=1 Tax=Rhizoctonia solani TaxID=456999 RepID=A0A8H8NX30_9AGAM|nr:FAD-binding domain protein [Rhizoctonia solani]QRW20990.1 FAD-binding domain protein [Rhizoctonia solani]